MMGVPEPLGGKKEMRMSESISLPNGVAIKINLSFSYTHPSCCLFWDGNTGNSEGGTGCCFFGSEINKQQLKYGERLSRATVSHARAPSQCDLSVSLGQD